MKRTREPKLQVLMFSHHVSLCREATFWLLFLLPLRWNRVQLWVATSLNALCWSWWYYDVWVWGLYIGVEESEKSMFSQQPFSKANLFISNYSFVLLFRHFLSLEWSQQFWMNREKNWRARLRGIWWEYICLTLDLCERSNNAIQSAKAMYNLLKLGPSPIRFLVPPQKKDVYVWNTV